MASKIVVNLDTSKENFLVAKCKQNDDLILEANIFENGLALDLTNKTITIQALKADNTYIVQNTDITKTSNKVTVNLIRDFSRVPGTTKIEIVLIESSKQNTTFSFYLEVVGSVIKGAVESRDTPTILEALQEKIVEAGQVKEETEQLIVSGGAATKGDIAKVNSDLDTMEQQFNKAVGAVTIDSEVVLARSSNAKNKTFTILDERLEDLEKDSYFPIKNLIVNGDFGKGIDGWQILLGNKTIEENVLTLEVTNLSTIGIYAKYNVVSGHKYYFSFNLNPKFKAKFSLGFEGTGMTNYTPQDTGWQKLSFLTVQQETTQKSFVVYHSCDDLYSIGDTFQVGRISCIDITATFGVGNEPTKEEMDRILSFYPNGWFDGTVNLAQNSKFLKFLLNEIRSKASIRQEAWITPTLLNGWTDFDVVNFNGIGYFKDQLGTVHLRGMLKGSIDKIIFTLPTGYRPGKKIYYPGVSNNVFATYEINLNGNLTCKVGNGTWVSLDGISFKGEL